MSDAFLGFGCPRCGSTDFVRNGPLHTRGREGRRRYRCKPNGHYWTDRENQFLWDGWVAVDGLHPRNYRHDYEMYLVGLALMVVGMRPENIDPFAHPRTARRWVVEITTLCRNRGNLLRLIDLFCGTFKMPEFQWLIPEFLFTATGAHSALRVRTLSQDLRRELPRRMETLLPEMYDPDLAEKWRRRLSKARREAV